MASAKALGLLPAAGAGVQPEAGARGSPISGRRDVAAVASPARRLGQAGTRPAVSTGAALSAPAAEVAGAPVLGSCQSCAEDVSAEPEGGLLFPLSPRRDVTVAVGVLV